ncbi:hypothetical protein IPZ61_02805 [Streptomyces sioyaensis]|uniref:hypothetical protein n=1 Tax=Streptomyces sioyaensis TaxID=67364 RepID=UPI001F3A6B86|nr:hypothetical protein [Streptomyces sioyaensis]MCF3172258.1 hypothetical protein [Streptomyces sioyaensis]
MNGLKVDRAGWLWGIDSTAGVAVYDLHDRMLIACFGVTGGASRSSMTWRSPWTAGPI